MKWKITDTDPTVYENLVQEEDRTSNSKYYITQYMILEKPKNCLTYTACQYNFQLIQWSKFLIEIYESFRGDYLYTINLGSWDLPKHFLKAKSMSIFDHVTVLWQT